RCSRSSFGCWRTDCSSWCVWPKAACVCHKSHLTRRVLAPAVCTPGIFRQFKDNSIKEATYECLRSRQGRYDDLQSRGEPRGAILHLARVQGESARLA